ncbi:zinc ribbon domain-containing protein [Leifsonia sp. H3M29-4]|uniref:double zinc ribbon domain-containing protein n=1 Tax=Salinibacterium metalliresistens TaxID=3031321 RepID=UPI0023D999D2|nr:zinc ribbon domain-containing protein [Salinibacterium metalliresistens]MDF1480028.1 zinc ribbon domain-containing protein [Salinibacterium metalliresistens]
MNCRYCSSELPSGALFCGECGRAVSSRQPDSAPVRVPEPAPEVQPEAEDQPEPVPESAPEPAAMPEPEPVASPPVDSHADPADHCTQCGAELAATDIFCGECGMVRQSVAARRPNDTAVLDPFPWGRPREPVAPPLVMPPAPRPTSRVPSVSAASLDDDDDTDETRLVDRTAKGERFVLQFSTGESVSVSGTGLIGRHPIAEPGEYFDHTVTIVDPGKSVSKTHLEFGQDAGAFWVSDRYSGNGTVVREPDRPARRCDPGKRYRVVRGSRIDIGEQFFVVS